MPKSGSVDLRRWQSFWHVDRNVISRIKFAYIFGQSSETIFVTVDDEVFGIGINSNGCLGVGDQERKKEPIRIDALCGKKLVSMAAGNDPHVLAVTAGGELYVWGANSYGQLGIGTVNMLTTPQLFNGLEQRKVKQVSCGFAHSLVLTENNELFSWGLNDKYQVKSTLPNQLVARQVYPNIHVFGHPSMTTNMESLPVLIEGIPDGHIIQLISCSACTSFALTTRGELFGWGNNGYGELGIGNFDDQSSVVRCGRDVDVTFKAIACGNSHVVALSCENQIFSWGHNSYGQVGNNNKINVPIPTMVHTEDLIFVEVGAIHNSHISAAVAHSGRVYAWGQLKDGPALKPKLTCFSSIHDVFATMSRPSVTYKPLRPMEGDDEEASISTCLRLHLDNEEVSDVKFLIGDQILYAHGSFLRMRSQYFRAMLSSNWDDRETREFRVQGYTYNVYRAYLEYLYTEKLHVSTNDAMDLLQLADEYCEQELKQMCENFILSAVTVDNVFSLYAASKKLSAKNLEDFSFNFAITHLNSATQTDAYRNLDSEVAKDFLYLAGKKRAFRN